MPPGLLVGGLAQNVAFVAPVEPIHAPQAPALLACLGAALAVGSAPASEGLMAMAALSCEPVRVPRSIIEGCLAAEPALRPRYATLVADWTARNARDAATLEGQCRAGLQQQTKDAQEVSRFWADIRRVNDETIRAKLAEYAGSKGGCDAALQDIGKGKADLGWLLQER